MEAAESRFKGLEQVGNPRKARGVGHPFQAILGLTLLGLVCGQTTMAHIALFARMHWPMLKEPLRSLRGLCGINRLTPRPSPAPWPGFPVSSCRVRLPAGWAKQSKDAQGNPLVMVNVLAHDLKLGLAQWPATEKPYEPGVSREQLGQLFEGYPGLRLLTMDARYAERDLCQAIVSHGRDYLVRIKGNQPAALEALTDGFAGRELEEPRAETPEKKPE